MKQILLKFITFYQKFISPTLKQLLGVKSFCRFYPTCSEYSIQSISEYGAIRGGLMSVKRIFSCQPFNKTYGSNI